MSTKKPISILLCICLIASMLVFPAAAESTNNHFDIDTTEYTGGVTTGNPKEEEPNTGAATSGGPEEENPDTGDTTTGESTTGGASVGSSACDTHTPDEAVEENLVEPTLDKAGSYDSVVYCSVCGEELDRITITIPAIQPSGPVNVSGRVTNYDGSLPGETVRIELQQGSIAVAQGSTDADGAYCLTEVPTGIYNLVATQADGRSVVVLAEIRNNEVLEVIRLPKNNVSTQVIVPEGTPAIVVGGLDAEADDAGTGDTHVVMSITLEQKADLTNSDDLDEQNQQISETQEAIKSELTEESERDFLFLEINIAKAEENVSETTNLLEIRVPYETHGRQAFQVLRHHDGAVQALTQEPNEQGEYIQIFDGYIVIHARMFSLYAITSLPESDVHTHVWEQPHYIWTAGGCAAVRGCIGCTEVTFTQVTFTVEDGKLKLSHIPTGLSVMVCTYDTSEGRKGQMLGVQVLTNLQKENVIGIAGDDMRIFFLGNNQMPLALPMNIQ